MVSIHEAEIELLVHGLTPTGPVPTAYDPDGVYPYPSFCETAARPEIRHFRAVVLENRWIRAEVLPGLGGRLHSLVEKSQGREVLFQEPVIRPVRILPRMAFISGGIEVSFPISHTPVQIEPVHWEIRKVDGRVYCFCGERELRFGMQWTLEWSLGTDDRCLSQRLLLLNPSGRAHPWVSWSIAAVPALADTQLQFPSGRVMVHGDTLGEVDWDSQGPKTPSEISRMAGYFWKNPDVNAFGAYNPSLGSGLYHIADPATVPGMKLWSFGMGGHKRWSNVSTLSSTCYLEIEASPILDQSIKKILEPGQTHWHQEFWIPSSEPLDIRRLELPQVRLIPIEDVPRFSWPPRPSVVGWRWLVEKDATLSDLELSGSWAPSGMDDLGGCLEKLAESSDPVTRSCAAFQLGAWNAGRDDVAQALAWLKKSEDDRARALAGRIYRSCLKDASAAAAEYRAIRSPVFALHPQVVVERDLALMELGTETLPERRRWLEKVAALDDERLVEQRAQLAYDDGRPEEALGLLTSRRFQLVLQRYARSDLFRRIRGADAPIPESLGEDDLARWGGCREHEDLSAGGAQ